MCTNAIVSVCIVTYNQERYIAKCLESILMQDVDFDYEILVGDDASTDNTAKIVSEFSARHPEKVILIRREKNLGGALNAFDLYKRAKGKYIAHMDGDDIAFPKKLRMQVDALESNPDCYYSTHDAEVIDINGNLVRASLKRYPAGKHDLASLYKKLPFFTQSTKLFRNDFEKDFYDSFSSSAIDVEIHVAQAKKGNIYHFDHALGAYRVFAGVSSSGRRVNPDIVDAYKRVYEESLRNNLPNISRKELQIAYAQSLMNFSYQSAYMGRFDDSLLYARQSMKVKFCRLEQLGLLVLSRLPSVLRLVITIRSAFKKYE